jgi:hypothetical protein
MSLSLITEAFKLNMQSGQKFVFMALCDQANDDGECFLCVETIAYKCSLSVRAVQGHLADLEQIGLVSREPRMGRSTIYRILIDALDVFEKHPLWLKRQEMKHTPAKSAGVQKTTLTPAKSAPTPAESAPPPAESAPITITKPFNEPCTNQKGKFDLPEWIPVEEWNAYEEMRKVIKKPMTNYTRKLAVNELLKLLNQGFKPTDVLNQSIMNSWQGLFPIKGQQANLNAYQQPKKFNPHDAIRQLNNQANVSSINIFDLGGSDVIDSFAERLA